jgi:hypothetical protein
MMCASCCVRHHSCTKKKKSRDATRGTPRHHCHPLLDHGAAPQLLVYQPSAEGAAAAPGPTCAGQDGAGPTCAAAACTGARAPSPAALAAVALPAAAARAASITAPFPAAFPFSKGPAQSAGIIACISAAANAHCASTGAGAASAVAPFTAAACAPTGSRATASIPAPFPALLPAAFPFSEGKSACAATHSAAMGAGVASLEDPGPACCRGGGGAHIRAACCRFATAMERASTALSKSCNGDELQIAPDAVGQMAHGFRRRYCRHSSHKGGDVSNLSGFDRCLLHFPG